MKQVYLGSTGLVVSELCLGTMSFGAGADEESATAIVTRFRDAGGTFFDTADVYADGTSEQILGRILRSDRDEVVIATKAHERVGAGPNDQSASRRHLVRAVDDSLRRLGMDWIDLFQVHRFDPTTPLPETLAALDELVRAGKLLHVGVSNWVGWQVERACRMQDAAGWHPLVSLQPQYSLVERNIELETLPAARVNGMAVLAYSPLAAGFLTGKYSRGAVTARGRFAQWVHQMSDQGWSVLDAVRALASDIGTVPAAVAVAWLLAKPDVIPIVGATTPEQLTETLAAADLDLSEDQVKALDDVSAPPGGYPWDIDQWPNLGRPPRRPASHT